MANKGDVDLVIRARNEASKSLDAINKALSTLVGSQDQAGASSEKLSKSLDQIATVATTVGNAYTKIQTDSDKAAVALARQESVLNENKASYEALAKQMEAAARVQDKLAQKSKALAAEQAKVQNDANYGPFQADRIKELAAAQEEANRGAAAAALAQQQLAKQMSRVGATVEAQQAAFQQSFYSFQDLAGNADKAAAALDKVRAAQSAAGKAAADAAAEQDKAAAAMAASAAAAAAGQDKAAAAQARRAALELRRSLQDAATGAQGGWQEAQQGIRGLVQTMAQVGPPTREQAANMAALSSAAAANKQAYREAQVAIEQYTRVLRDPKADPGTLAAAYDRARAALAGVRNTMVDVSSIAMRTAQAVREVGSSGNTAAGGTSNLDRSLQSLFSNSRRSLSMFQRLRGEVLALASSFVGLYATIEGGRKVLEASMNMQAVESRLNVVTGGDQAKTAQEMTWVRKESERLGFSLTTLAGEWSKFAVSAQASNFTMDQTRKIFTSVSEAGRVLKLDSTRMESAFVALTQMMSKGTIQMEELRQQLGEHIPGAFALMAQAAGVSGAELTKMMEKGQLTSDYLIKFADVLDKRFGPQLSKSLQMTQAELGRFQTAMTLALNKIADAGLLDAFTEALRDLQKVLRSTEAEAWFERIGSAAGALIKMLMAVGKNLDIILAALVAVGAAKGVAYVMQLVQGFITLRATIAAATTATAGLSAATAAIGGPIGIIIGIAAGAFALLATRVKESETAMISAKRSVEEITTAYRNGANSAKEWADAMKGLSNLQIDRDLATLKTKMKSELEEIFQPFGRAFMTRARASDSPLKGVYEEIQKLAEGARNGTIPIEQFTKRLDEIGKAHPQLAELALRMQDSAKKAGETEQALAKFQASIRLMRGEATEADKKLLGLADATKSLSDAQNDGAKSMDKYTAAMDRLAKNVPDLKRAMEYKASVDQIGKDLQAAFDAAGDDESLKNAALDRANKALAALREGYDSALIKEFSNTRGDALEKSVQLLKGFESFRSTPYWDVNAYRVGYGSDTVTLDDGSIQKVVQGMTVTQEGALRDLVRRIGEFQDTVKRQVGSDRFSAFSADQQAALTSIAYNYGSLPKRIIDAVKYGTNEEIAKAVRGLAGDNGGVNRNRRNAEADILARSTANLVASTEKIASDRDDKVSKVLADLTVEIKKGSLSKRDQYIEDALKKIAAEPGKPAPSAAQVNQVREAAGRAYDEKEGVETQQKILALQQQIAQSKAGISREEFIANNARKDGVNLLTEQGQKYALLQGQIYDRENAEKRVNALQALRKELQEQITFQQNQGNPEAANGMIASLTAVNTQLKEAIANAVKFYQTMGGEGADLAVMKLKNLNNSIVTTAKVTLDAKQINQDFASGAVTAFSSMAEAMAGWIDGTKSGKEAIRDIGQAFLKFAADFLMKIAQMILQQAIFNAISGAFGGGGGGGIGGFISGLFHDGGVVGQGGGQRLAQPGWFTNAVRYHTGGIAGLRPNEVPAILERNEEVLTRDDPRHVMNGGMGQAAAPNIKIVNAIDAGDFVSQGLATDVGQTAFLNFMRANRSAVKGALG